VGALKVFFWLGMLVVGFCLLSALLAIFAPIKVRRWGDVPAFDNQFLLVVFNTLDVCHHSNSFHIVGEVQLVFFFVIIKIFTLLGRWVSPMRRPLDLQFGSESLVACNLICFILI